jgi:Flp pilus assembly protein TadD
LKERVAKYRTAMMAGGALLLIVLIAGVGVLYGRSQPPPNRALTTVPSRSQHATPAAVPVTAEKATIERRFLDHKLAGGAAYTEGDYESAADRYRKAIAENPTDADALNNLGQVLARVGRAAEAIPYLERAGELYPNVWAYRFNLAHAHGQMGDWARAVAGYRAAQELFPDDYVTQFNLAHALHKQGSEEEAIAEYRKAIALAPGEPSFHLSLAVSYENLKRLNDATNSYHQFLEMTPDAPEAQQVKGRIKELSSSHAQ